MPPKSNATKNEVNTFLIEFKTLLSQKGIVFEPRTYNGITTIELIFLKLNKNYIL